MADAVVDGDAGGEGDPLDQLLVLLERLRGLLHQARVSQHAPWNMLACTIRRQPDKYLHLSDRGARFAPITDLLENLCKFVGEDLQRPYM